MTSARMRLALGAFVLGLTALSAIGYAQTGRLKGKVVDAENKPVAEVFKLAQESEETRALYGETSFGQGCLLARRLIEHWYGGELPGSWSRP